MLRRLMSARVEVWLLLLLALAFLAGLVFYGSLVRAAALGSARHGWIGRAALATAEFPGQTRRVIGYLVNGADADLGIREDRFGTDAGLIVADPATAARDGYLVLARYDGDRGRSVVELVDLASGQVVHTWAPDIAAINARSTITSNLTDLAVDNAPGRARMYSPLVAPDGSFVYNNLSPLVRLDVCGQRLWTVDQLFHHSNIAHPDGGYWVSTHIEPQTIEGVKRTFFEDSVTHVSEAGEVMFQKSVPQILIDNGLGRLVYGLDFYSDDPLHLNDIEPARSDGPHWQRGDIFLSLRNVSAVVLYRPSENRVIRVIQGPWANQHDVDILDDHRISVFNNNRFNSSVGSYVEGANDVVIYDLATDAATSPFGPALASLDVRTVSEGLADILADGGVFVEESNFGRIMRLDAAGKPAWTYINRAGNGRLYLTSWSSLVPRATGDAVIASAKAAGCP